MFSNLTPLHSYDPIEILRLVYRLIFGGASTATDWGSRTHAAWTTFFTNLPFFLINIFARYVVFSFFLSILFIFLIVMYDLRRREIKAKIMSKVLPSEDIAEKSSEDVMMENPKWKIVEEHINSDDANKWKLAILESDIILSELLDSLQLPGDGVGEKLKNVEASDFDHIEEAWEAHKIRNAIAHQGSDFLLTQREAKRVIRLYKSVFEEFRII